MKRVRIDGAVVVLAMLGAAACGPDFEAYCDEREACLGGNEADIEACVAYYDGASDAASDLGCSDEFDEYFECASGASECRTQSTGMPCTTDENCGTSMAHCNAGQCEYKNYGVADDEACKAEDNAWEHCGEW